MKVQVDVDEESYSQLEKLASSLGVGVGRLASILLDAAASYSSEIAAMASEIRVRRENKPYSVIEELFYYGVEAWRGIVQKILDKLKARGRFELEELDLDPSEPSIEVELVALEGSDLKADRVRINWSLDGVIVEAYYYVEEFYEHVPAKLQGFDMAYLPDEEALLVSRTGRSLDHIPPLYEFDRVASRVLGS